MTTKFDDAQLVLLNAAARREDRCLEPPTGPTLAKVKRAAAKLLAAGLVKEAKARKAMPVWRRDEETGEAVALKITAAGLKAIAVEPDEGEGGEIELGEQGGVKAKPSTRPTDASAEAPTADADGSDLNESRPPRPPRAGTKIEAVTALLRRASGATLEEIVAATGWLPHTARAALTGLRKRGFAIALDRTDRARGSAYRIATAEVGPQPETPAQAFAVSTTFADSTALTAKSPSRRKPKERSLGAA